MKKTLAILLTLALVLCMMPGTAFATEGETAPVDISTVTVNLSKAESIYTGQEQNLPTVTITGYAETTDFTVSWDKGNDTKKVTDAGVYTATITPVADGKLKGNAVTKTFTIVPVDFSKVSLKYTGGTTLNDSTISGVKVSDVVVTQGSYTVETSLYTVSASKQTDNKMQVAVTPKTSGTNVVGDVRYINDIVLTTALNGNYRLVGTNADGTIPNQVYNGGTAIKPTVYVVPASGAIDLSKRLIEGVDFKLEYSGNTTGSARAKVTAIGMGKYSSASEDSIYINFDIVGKDISYLTVYTENTVQGAKPKVKIVDGSKTLVDGIDYEIRDTDYNSNAVGINAGTATISGLNNYSGTKKVTYAVIDPSKRLTYDNVVESSNRVVSYNGSVQSGNPVVKVGNTTLTAGYDYVISYMDSKGTVVTSPKDAGTYTVYITGSGQYASDGKIIAGTLRIDPVPLDFAEIVLGSSTVQYGGKSVPKVSVKHIFNNFYFDEDDYTVSYRYLTSTSAYLKPTAVVTPKAGGNLTTATNPAITELTKEFSMATRSFYNCLVNFSDYRSSKNYDGTAFTPTVVVKDTSLNRTLVLNSDYTVSYKDENGKTVTSLKDAGVYTVTITGVGGYSGTQTLTYTINGTDISAYTVTLKADSVKADGTAKTPSITSVKYGFYSTLSSADYTVTYEDYLGNAVTAYTMKTPGTYKVIVTGKGGYTGSAYAYFTIVGEPQEINIAKTSYKVYKDSDSFTLKPTATGDGTGFSYVSSDPTVASVSATGKVTIHKLGRAKITITTTGVKKSDPATEEVFVKVYPDKGQLSQKPWTEGKKASMRVRWDKQDDVTYYEVRYSRKSDFRSGSYKTKKVTASTLNYDTQSTRITGLKSGYKYYVKVRAVKVVENDYGQEIKYYGKWSGWKSVNVK